MTKARQQKILIEINDSNDNEQNTAAAESCKINLTIRLSIFISTTAEY